MVNWKNVISTVGKQRLQNFATGQSSGRTLTSQASFSCSAGEVRGLLRRHGVTYARRLARKALKRRTV